MAQDDSYSYVPLVVGSLLVAACLSAVVAPADGRNRADAPADWSAATGIEAQPTTVTPTTEIATTQATESTDGEFDGTTRQPDEVERHLGPVSVTIFLNCSFLEVDVEPTTHTYDLKLVYRDTETGQRIPLLAGPFTGSVDDPFGETRFQLVEVQVRVERLPPTGQFAPDRCLRD